jgi:hypothetical protein
LACQRVGGSGLARDYVFILRERREITGNGKLLRK